jgi:CubicO group peptidase (beta-lactamase class C family)
MMDALPPPPERQVTLANWRTHPFSRWGIQHMREVIPTAPIERDPERHWPLPRRLRDLGGLAFERYGDGGRVTLAEWLAEAHVDGLLVLRHGEIVAEHYANGLTPTRNHLAFSVTKSVTALGLGLLVDAGRLDPDVPVTRYVPEVAGSGWGDATVRQVLDMQVELDYDEVYDDPRGLLGKLREAAGWSPPSDPHNPLDVRSFLPSFGRRPGPHGQRFRYLTPNSELLGWIGERAGGMPFATLLTRGLWQPMGAECSADIAVDRLGAPRTGGGMAATLRDFGRLTELVRCQGRAGDRQVLPAWWIDDILTQGDPAAWAGSEFDYMMPGNEGNYRSQWYLCDRRGTQFMAAGIHGQWLWGDRGRGVSIVKLASRPEASVKEPGMTDLAYFQAIAAAL